MEIQFRINIFWGGFLRKVSDDFKLMGNSVICRSLSGQSWPAVPCPLPQRPRLSAATPRAQGGHRQHLLQAAARQVSPARNTGTYLSAT